MGIQRWGSLFLLLVLATGCKPVTKVYQKDGASFFGAPANQSVDASPSGTATWGVVFAQPGDPGVHTAYGSGSLTIGGRK